MVGEGEIVDKGRFCGMYKKQETFRFGRLPAVRTGLEPVTSCVTGRHSNQAELTHQFLLADAKVSRKNECTKFFAIFFQFFLNIALHRGSFHHRKASL